MDAQLIRVAAAAGFVAFGTLCAAAQASLSVEADGTELKVTFADGRVLRSRDLVGARLVMAIDGRLVRLRIDAVARKPRAGSEIWLHTLSVQDGDGEWRNYCAPGPDGQPQGIPIAMQSSADGHAMPSEAGSFQIACTAGAYGKCATLGYLPTSRESEGWELFNACSRMIRADYCGSGVATTAEGRLIDVYDDVGIQQPDDTPGLSFEAGWTAKGAVCVHHVRVKENLTLDALIGMCPRLQQRVGEVCSEENARALGARLFNSSRP